MRQHIAVTAEDRGQWYWVCLGCGAGSEDDFADEGDAIDAAERHERDPFPAR